MLVMVSQRTVGIYYFKISDRKPSKINYEVGNKLSRLGITSIRLEVIYDNGYKLKFNVMCNEKECYVSSIIADTMDINLCGYSNKRRSSPYHQFPVEAGTKNRESEEELPPPAYRPLGQ